MDYKTLFLKCFLSVQPAAADIISMSIDGNCNIYTGLYQAWEIQVCTFW